MKQNRYDIDDDQGFQIPAHQLQDYPVTDKIYPDFMSETKRHLTINHRKNKHYSSQKPNLRHSLTRKISINSNPFKGHFNVSMLMNTCFEEVDESDRNDLVIPSIYNNKGKDNSINNRFSQIIQSNAQLQHVFLKSKRVQIGQDIVYNVNNNQQQFAINQEIVKFPKSSLLFRYKEDIGTHSFFKKIIESQDKTFLDCKYNRLLKQHIMISKYKIPKKAKKEANQIQFNGDFQSGNIDFVLKSEENEYNVYLKRDTYTRGHQGWFYFKIKSHLQEKTRIKINICNLKKKIKMAKLGQKIYFKSNQTNNQWKTLNQELEVCINQNNVSTISFSIIVHPHQELYLSLIPPYTYTDLLKHVEELQKSKDVKVQVLTYSVTGLALPLITITKNAKQMKNETKKNVILVSARIHPGQTCGSFIVYGLMKQLISGKKEIESILNNTVIKIIPMLNPDGVVFGNFRTNYLGDDLNRSFHFSDEVIYPQIIALKTLGKTLKKQYAENFLFFIDLHGHSCETNSFVYGPQYDINSDQFIQCRVFPKILDEISEYFLYEKSNFRLQNYKHNTARGYFLRKLKISSYTVQTSYAIFKSKGNNSQYKHMSTKQWIKYGQQIAMSFKLYLNYISFVKKAQTQKIDLNKDNKNVKDQKSTKNSAQIKDINEIKRLKNKKPIINEDSKFNKEDYYFKIRKDIEKNASKEINFFNKDDNSSESDAQSQNNDLPNAQKQEMIKNIKQIIYPSSLYNKINKPAMILPSVVPSIYSQDKKKEQKDKFTKHIPRIIHINKQKKTYANANNQYTEYLLKNINNLKNLKPQVVNFNKLNLKKSLEKTINY